MELEACGHVRGCRCCSGERDEPLDRKASDGIRWRQPPQARGDFARSDEGLGSRDFVGGGAKTGCVVKYTLPLGIVFAGPREQYAAAGRAPLGEPRGVLRQLDLDGRADRGAREEPARSASATGRSARTARFELRRRRDAAERLKVSDHLIAELGDRGELAPALSCCRDDLADPTTRDAKRRGDFGLTRPRAGRWQLDEPE